VLERPDLRFLDTVGWVDRGVAEVYRLDRKLVGLARALATGSAPGAALAKVRQRNVESFVDHLLARSPELVLVETELEHAGTAALERDPRFERGYLHVLEITANPRTSVWVRRDVRLLAPTGTAAGRP
jgi:hypothetical protein